MIGLRPEEGKIFLLPMDDGRTAITYVEENMSHLITCPLKPDVEEDGSFLQKKIQEFAEFFPAEYRLKISLFKEMSRSLPNWAELRDYSWQKDILDMSVNSNLIDPYRLTENEELLLKWLLFTVNDPKLAIVPENCHGALLERAKLTEPLPTAAFLLQHEESWLEGKAAVGFASLSPEEVFPLVYLFPEAAKGLCFTRSLQTALDSPSAPRQTFSLAGATSPRFRVVLMMEFLLHPGIECNHNHLEEEPKQFGETRYRITVTDNIRPVALLLYRAPVSVMKNIEKGLHSKVKLNHLLMFALISLCIVAQTLFKIK